MVNRCTSFFVSPIEFRSESQAQATYRCVEDLERLADGIFLSSLHCRHEIVVHLFYPAQNPGSWRKQTLRHGQIKKCDVNGKMSSENIAP